MATWLTKIDRRVDGSEQSITNEAHTVGEDTANFVFLNEVPLKETISSVSISGYTEVGSSPSAGQFLVYYTGRLAGAVQFAAVNNGASVQISYKGRGSALFARDINRLQTEKLDRDGEIVATGAIKFALGSTSAPSVTFNGRLTVGLCSPAADNLGFVAADRFRFFAPSDSEAHTHISYSVSPFSGGLILFGPGGSAPADCGVGRTGTQKLALATSATVALTVDASQRIGIGEATPSYLLHVKGAAPSIFLEHTGGPDVEVHTNDGSGLSGIRSNPQSSALSIQDSGNIILCRASGKVGIGTSTPSTLFQANNAASDYLQYGTNNPRLYFLVPTGINGLRIDADTTPFELRKLGDLSNQLSISGSDLSMTFAPTDATALTTLRDSQAILFNGKYWNGTTSVTAYQGKIYGKTTNLVFPKGGVSIGTTSGDGIDTLFVREDGNIGIRTTSQFGSGTGVVGILNAITVPNTNPSGGGVLYAETGALKYRGSSGTVTTLGPADPHCPNCDRDFALEFESDQHGYLAVCVWCLVDSLKILGQGKSVIEQSSKAREARYRGIILTRSGHA